MAFDIEAARKEGYSDAEIADHLAQQSGFDVAGARNEGHSDAEIISHLSGAQTTTPAVAPGQVPPGQTSPVGTGVLTAGIGALGEAGVKTAPHIPFVKKIFKAPEQVSTGADVLKQATGTPEGFKFSQQYHSGAQSNATFNEQQRLANEELTRHSEFQAKKLAHEKANPGRTLTPGGLDVPVADAQRMAQEEAKAQARIQAQADAVNKARAKREAIPKGIAGPLGRVASYGLAGAELESGANKFQQGNPVGGTLDVAGAGATLATPHLINKPGLPGKFGKAAAGLSILAPVAAELVPGHAAGGVIGNIASQAAWNAPYIAGDVASLGKNVAKGAVAPAAENALDIAWAMAPINPLTAGLMAAAPSEAGAGSTLDDWYAQKAAEKAAHDRIVAEHKKAQSYPARGQKLLTDYELNQIKNTPVPKFAPGGSILKKFSEVIAPHEGKTLVATLADRTKATEGFHGGPGFINLHPDYTWAVDAPAVVSKHMRAVERFGGPDQTVLAPMLMSSSAHKSNRDVFRQIYGDMADKIRSGELTPDQIAKLDARILAEKGADLSKSPGVSSPEFLQFADTFHRRGKVADILGLKKTGAVDLQKHLDETIDPALRGVETGAIGPQLFTMEGSLHKPDVHPSYEHLFLGEKGADQFTPVPREFLFRDLEKQAMEQMGRPMTDYNYRNVLNAQGGLPNQFIDEKLIRSLENLGYKKGGQVAGYAPGGQILKGGLGFFKPAAKSHSQDPVVARALEEYLKGNISQEERMAILNKQMPLRPWTELPPAYSDEQIKMALMENKRPKALLPVPEGMRVGNRLDIPAYTQNGVYVDTTHNLAGSNSPISYNRTGHLTDVEFSSKPNQAVRVGLGTKEQALTPLGAEMGAAKSPFAMIKGTNVGTSDEEVRRMMAEYINDPNWAQIGMDPRRHSQFYDKSTGLPVWSAEEKLQSGPLVLAPRRGLETTSWDDPRLDLTDFPGKKYKMGGLV